MAAGIATLPFPIYGAIYRAVFPIFDADGDLVTGAAADTPDTEVSTDCGTFADSAELIEIATASGMYYKDFTAAEMTGGIVAAIFKTATAGTKTTPLVLYPRRLPSIRDNTCQTPSAVETKCKLDSSASADDDFYNGCYVMLNANTGAGQARLIIDYAGATTECTVFPNWATDPDNTTTFSILVPENAITTGWAGAAVADTATAGYPAVNINGLATTSAGKLDDILDGTGGTGIKVNSIENTGTTTLTGAVSLGSTLGITGAVTLSSTLGVGAVTFASLAVTGALSVGTTTTLTGAVSAPAGIAANITGNLIGTVSTVTTNSDMRGTDNANTTKTGYTLTNLPDATTALFAAMFGGAGTPLKLTKLTVEANDATPAVDIDNAGAGAAVKVTSDSGDALLLQSVSGADLKLDGGGMIETTAGADVIELGVDKALENAIPGSPTADSINQRIKAIDVLTEASGNGDLAAIKGVTDVSIYTAHVDLAIDETNTKDEYVAQWFKDGVPVTSGVTSPTIQVVKRADGSDLVAEQAMTQIVAGAYKYDAETTERSTAGEGVLAVVGATIDGSARSWKVPLSRDSSA